MTVEKQLLITLWMLASQETIRSMGDRFGVCNATVYRRVISAINRNWTSRIITWPCGVSSVTQTNFQVVAGFKG